MFGQNTSSDYIRDDEILKINKVSMQFGIEQQRHNREITDQISGVL